MFVSFPSLHKHSRDNTNEIHDYKVCDDMFCAQYMKKNKIQCDNVAMMLHWAKVGNQSKRKNIKTCYCGKPGHIAHFNYKGNKNNKDDFWKKIQ